MGLCTFSVMTGAKLFLTAVSPLQSFIAETGRTHEFLNRQALIILQQDGYSDCAEFLHAYLPELNEGVYWADSGWKNVSHYFNPCGKGLWLFNSAPEECNKQFQMSLKEASKFNLSKAAFYLGAAAHLIQDMCVPHHARGKIFLGHQEYEDWVGQTYYKYAVSTKGDYTCSNVAAYAVRNALASADLLNLVGEQATEASYCEATKIILPLAQQTTAGLFLYYFQQIVNRLGLLRIQNLIVA